MKLIKCNKCGRYFQVLDNEYQLSKCTGCESTNLTETIYTLEGNPIDWEQRRYEIAKNMFVSIFTSSHISQYSFNEAQAAKEAIHSADVLIEELKKN